MTKHLDNIHPIICTCVCTNRSDREFHDEAGAAGAAGVAGAAGAVFSNTDGMEL